MSFQQDKHDIGIVDQDGDSHGFLLVRDKNDIPIYSVDEDEYLAEQQFSGEPDYGALPPEKELSIRQDDWRSGFGLETYDPDDPKRYFSAINMDLRFRGMAICGPKAETASLPTLMTIVNGNCESLTGWTKAYNDGYDPAISTTEVYAGTNSIYMRSSAGGGAWSRIDQNVGSWANAFQDTTVSLMAYMWANVANRGRIALEDDGGITYSSNVAGDSDWHKVYVTRQVNSSATYLKAWARNDDLNADVYVDEIAISSLGVHGKHWAEFDDDLFFSSNNALLRVNDTTGDINFQGGLPNTISDLEAFSDDKLYVALGMSSNYYAMNIGEVFAENTLTNNQMQFLAMVHTNADTMYGSDGDNTIRSTTDPTSTNWSAQTTIDTSAKAITDMFSFDNALYIFKEDRPYYLESGVPQILTNITRPLSTALGGKNSLEWLGKIYMPWGKTILEWDAGTFTWRNPASFGTNIGDFDGDVQALAGDEEYLFAAIDNASKVEILAGRLETIDGTTKWVWHPIAELTIDGCETMFVSNVYEKRLWIASTKASDDLHYIKLYTSYGDPINDANRNFQTGGYFITPYHHANFKGDDKAYLKQTAIMTNTDANVYFQGSYQKLGDTTWTNINSTANFITSPVTTIYIPEDGSANKPVSTMVRFRFNAFTNAVTSTPVLKGYDCRAILYPTRRKIHRCLVRCADGLLDKQGQPLDETAATIKTILEEAADDATWPVTFYDPDGTTKYVRILPTAPFSRFTRDEKSKNKERVFNMVMQEVALS